ncbi:hypothetical protein BaRGS_00012714 [Batillaria attramentaria]|uniref:Uncharacterized protein n=1 Tax=Batillaria attramentaria TaxID=370345 RepID=A0ABD0L9I4_9CAEN
MQLDLTARPKGAEGGRSVSPNLFANEEQFSLVMPLICLVSSARQTGDKCRKLGACWRETLLPPQCIPLMHITNFLSGSVKNEDLAFMIETQSVQPNDSAEAEITLASGRVG